MWIISSSPASERGASGRRLRAMDRAPSARATSVRVAWWDSATISSTSTSIAAAAASSFSSSPLSPRSSSCCRGASGPLGLASLIVAVPSAARAAPTTGRSRTTARLPSQRDAGSGALEPARTLLPLRHVTCRLARHGTCMARLPAKRVRGVDQPGGSARLCVHAMLAIPKAILLASNIRLLFPAIYPTLARRGAPCSPWHVRCSSVGAAHGSAAGWIACREKGRSS